MNSPELLANTTQKTPPQIAMHVQENNLSKRTPRSVIVFLLLFFPPLAWLLMIKDKTYHHWLIKVVLISGIISLCFLSFFYLTVGVQLTDLYAALGLEDAINKEIMLASMWSGGLFAVLQIFFAIYCHQYLKHHGQLHTLQLCIIAVILVSVLVITFIPPLMTIQAVYSLSSLY